MIHQKLFIKQKKSWIHRKLIKIQRLQSFIKFCSHSVQQCTLLKIMLSILEFNQHNISITFVIFSHFLMFFNLINTMQNNSKSHSLSIFLSALNFFLKVFFLTLTKYCLKQNINEKHFASLLDSSFTQGKLFFQF